MELFIEKTNKKEKMKFSGSVSKLLSKLSMNPETVIVVCNGEIMTDEDILKDSDSVRILSVVSGG